MNNIKKSIIRDWQLYILLTLPIAYFIIFHYIPMYGVSLAFKDFSFSKGIFGSPWVGIKHFVSFFESFYFLRIIRNTFLIGFFSVVFGFPAPIIFALLLNEIKFKHIKMSIHTISFVPYFISTVVMVSIIQNFFAVDGGIVNIILNRIGISSINFMTSPEWFRFLYIGSSIWQGFGFGSIIYLAVISSINIEYYEVIDIDGGNRFHKIKYVTLPFLKPTIIVLLILSLGSVFSVGFEKVILMYTPSTYETADVIGTFVYRRGIQNADYSFATAVGFFNSIVNFTLIYIFNSISKMTGENLF